MRPMMASSSMTAEAERMKSESESDWPMLDAPSWGSAFPGDGAAARMDYNAAFQPYFVPLSAFLQSFVSH